MTSEVKVDQVRPYTASTVDLGSVTVTGGTITGITDLAVADGGTGASTAAAARTNLGSTSVGDAVFTAASAAAARTVLDVPSNAEAILDTLVDAKGDLLVGTAADTVARQAVGTNGHVVMADSAVTNGLGYYPIVLGPSGRLTLTSVTPVTSSDVTGAATVYFTPYNGNVIQLYDGSGWITYTFAELSQALNDATKSPAAGAADTLYDMFVWNDAGTLRCTRGAAWTNSGFGTSARGTGVGTTELELFEGRYVNKVAVTNGPAARRGLYVGTFKTDPGAATVTDSKENRRLWNMYNRIDRSMLRLESTDSWTYNTNAWRYANNSSANRLEVVRGLDEELVWATAISAGTNNVGSIRGMAAIGLNSSTSGHQGSAVSIWQDSENSAGFVGSGRAEYNGYPGIGSHFLAWQENGLGNGGTSTWYGDNGTPTTYQTGMTGGTRA